MRRAIASPAHDGTPFDAENVARDERRRKPITKLCQAFRAPYAIDIL
jgi:hypothetical protein